MDPRIVVADADPLSADALALLAEAAAEARQRYPELFAPNAPPPTNAPLGPRDAFLLTWHDGELAGCGALRPQHDPPDATCAELRRMFVRASVRRHGVARTVLAALEQRARALGYRRLRIETGDRQPEAIALYDRYADRRIAPYGPYAMDPTSVCFEKDLTD